jgi:mono/diheme cytochrome c family protein
MNMKKISLIAVIAVLLYACGGAGNSTQSASPAEKKEEVSTGNPSYDPKRGEGKFTKVEVGEKVDEASAGSGEKTYGVKCSSCHKLTDEKLVGPGWKGVSTRRTPEWIMNFITNTDEMINKDPAAQAQLEICLVRMPNQNLTDVEARNLYEFMRKNDGTK